MNLRKLIALIAIPVFISGITSCKKDEDDTEYITLDGSLRFEIPQYIEQGATITVKPTGVTHPDGESIGYAWKVSTPMEKPDTVKSADGSFTYTFPDTLKTYTVYCYAFAKGYSSSSHTKECTTVKGGINGSITNIDFSKTKTEQIQGKTYHYVTAGGLDWMCRNISDDSAGIPYMHCDAMNDVFGRYYSYEEASSICPEGWRLPTDAEWVSLAEAAGAPAAESEFSTMKGVAAAMMGNAYFNDDLMWKFWPEVGDITNDTGFSALPTGYVMLGTESDGAYPTALFKGYKEYAVFWTSTPAEEGGMAYYRYFISNQPDLMISKGDMKSFGASVRCVR